MISTIPDKSVRLALLTDEAATVQAGRRFASIVRELGVQAHLCVSLEGELGAGKTTFSRGVLTGFGHSGRVKSPTYTLVEPYELPDMRIYHFDLYRLGDPEELEFMGIRDYFSETGISLIEWYEKGAGVLPEPDLIVSLQVTGHQRQLEVRAVSPTGNSILGRWQQVC